MIKKIKKWKGIFTTWESKPLPPTQALLHSPVHIPWLWAVHAGVLGGTYFYQLNLQLTFPLHWANHKLAVCERISRYDLHLSAVSCAVHKNWFVNCNKLMTKIKSQKNAIRKYFPRIYHSHLICSPYFASLQKKNGQVDQFAKSWFLLGLNQL